MGRRFLHANFKHTATSALMQLVHGSAASSTMQGARRALASSALMASLARSGVSSTSMLAASAMPLLRAAAPFSIQAAAAVTAPTTTNGRSGAANLPRRLLRIADCGWELPMRRSSGLLAHAALCVHVASRLYLCSDLLETTTGTSSSGSGRTVSGPSSASSGALTVVSGEDGQWRGEEIG
jgi:hypothetical protein